MEGEKRGLRSKQRASKESKWEGEKGPCATDEEARYILRYAMVWQGKRVGERKSVRRGDGKENRGKSEENERLAKGRATKMGDRTFLDAKERGRGVS